MQNPWDIPTGYSGIHLHWETEDAQAHDPTAEYYSAYSRFVNQRGLSPNAFLIAPDRHAELLTYAREQSVLKWCAVGRLLEVDHVITMILGCVLFVLPALPSGAIRAALVDEWPPY